jgi:hypothetical protein
MRKLFYAWLVAMIAIAWFSAQMGEFALLWFALGLSAAVAAIEGVVRYATTSHRN